MEKIYRFLEPYSNRLIQSLLKTNISFKLINEKANNNLKQIAFSINEQQRKELAKDYFWANIPLHYFVGFTYTEDEIQKSEYVQLICNNVIEMVDEEKSLIGECREINILGQTKWHHTKQCNPLSVKKVPKLSQKHFFVDHLWNNFMFVDQMIIEELKDNNISGIVPLEVYVKGKLAYNFYQIKGEEIVSSEFIELSSGKNKRCKICGKKIISSNVENDMLIIKKKLTKDFYETDRVFGMLGVSEYILSQKAYRILKDKNLLNGCSVIPVFCVE